MWRNDINDTYISYNRILDDDSYFISVANRNTFNNNIAIANWFGNNTPDLVNKFLNILVINYCVVNATAIKNTGVVGENWLINYTFYLNGTNDRGNYENLPFFKSQLFNDSSLIEERVAYNNGDWSIPIEHPSIENFSVVLDYEKIEFENFISEKGKSKLDIDVIGKPTINNTITINSVLKNIQGKILANKKVTLLVNGKVIESKNTDSNGKVSFYYTFSSAGTYTFQLIFEEDFDYNSAQSNELTLDVVEPPIPNPTPNNTTNNTNNTNKANEVKHNNYQDAHASMKETGIPILAILLVVLSCLGIFVSKK